VEPIFHFLKPEICVETSSISFNCNVIEDRWVLYIHSYKGE